MAPVFPLHIRGTVLWILGIGFPSFPYGALTLYRAAFQQTSGRWLSQTRVQTSHPPFLSEGVRFVLFPFQSPLIRESHCFLLLRVLRCFNSPRPRSLPIISEEMGSPIQEPRVQWLHAPTPGLLQLATLFITTRAKPSTIQRA